MYIFYSFLFTLGFILALPYYMLRRGRGAVLQGILERFGTLPSGFRQRIPGAILVHAVSLGETLALIPLVEELERRYPDRKIFLSHTTPTGRQAGSERLPGIAGQFYLPLDWCWTMKRMMHHLRPALIVIGETELWPNFFRTAKKSGSRLVIVNARISERSLPRYRLGKAFLRHVLADVDCILAQSSVQKERFLSLGADVKKVIVTGNMKFEFSPSTRNDFSQKLGARFHKDGIGPIMIAASTMPGEEEKILRAWKEVRRDYTRGLLIIAPRRPERFDAVARLLENKRVNFVRRSQMGEAHNGLGRKGWPGLEVLLLDSIGELGALFEICNLAYVGGSLVATGGHNPLEPAYWAKPVLFGPYMENFSGIADLFVRTGAATQVPDEHALAREMLTLLRNPKVAQIMGETARKLFNKHQGATARNLRQIEKLLKVETSGYPMVVQST